MTWRMFDVNRMLPPRLPRKIADSASNAGGE
jgi:hypothetical protein